MIHELKTIPEYFEAVQSELKTFEVRKADRPFAVDDFLALNEYTEYGYTGRCILVRVTYILKSKEYCKDGYWIMGVAGCEIRTKGERYNPIGHCMCGIPIYQAELKGE